MVKTALKVYKNNIWQTFSIIGIVAIGIFAGLGIAIPGIINATNNTYESLVDLVKKQVSTFNSDNFLKSLVSQFKAMDWANPIKTIVDLFSGNTLSKILSEAFSKGNLTPEQVTAAVEASKDIINNFSNTVTLQINYCVLSIAIAALISYVAVKIVVRARTTQNRSVGWFILSLFLNMLNLALVFFLSYLVTTKVTNKIWYSLAMIGICILMYILTFLNAMACYMSKEVKASKILNFKNFFLLFLSNLIILAISTVIVVIVGIFSDVVAVLLAIPLLMITNIVTDCVVIAYITEHNGGKTIDVKPEEKPKANVAKQVKK